MIKNYHASHAPSPEEWLGAEKIHAIIHVVVENQLAMKVVPVPATIARLTRQGLNRHDAIHAIGSILIGDIQDIIKKEQEHNIKKYRRKLEKLTAKRWLKGLY